MSERDEGAEKPPSLRIKTKAGEVIDISLLAMQGLPADIDRLGPIAAGLVDALEAALSLEPGCSGAWICIDCAKTVRKAAGVIET